LARPNVTCGTRWGKQTHLLSEQRAIPPCISRRRQWLISTRMAGEDYWSKAAAQNHYRWNQNLGCKSSQLFSLGVLRWEASSLTAI
jgi:hypothetical protein